MEELTLAIGDIIVGIDIGTSKVSTFVGEVHLLVKLIISIKLKLFVVQAQNAKQFKKAKL